MDFELTILGCNSAIAQHGRHPTSHILRIGSQMYMIDCGEGTQFRILQNAVKWFKINHIFISHLHGDHYCQRKNHKCFLNRSSCSLILIN